MFFILDVIFETVTFKSDSTFNFEQYLFHDEYLSKIVEL